MAEHINQHLKRQSDGSFHLTIRATPNARQAHIKVDDTGVRVYVTVVPENGKANATIIKTLAKQMGRPKSAFTLIRGHTARDKTFRISP